MLASEVSLFGVVGALCAVVGAGFYWRYARRASKPPAKAKGAYRRRPVFIDEKDTERRAAKEGKSSYAKAAPHFIDMERFLQQNPADLDQFTEDLKNRSYACFKVGSDVKRLSRELTEVALQYFSQPKDTKELNKDPLANNIGFVEIPGIREYIKLRTNSPDGLWPQYPSDFKKKFIDFHHKYSQIGLVAFSALSNWIDPEEPEPQTYIRKDDSEIISKVLEERSTLSMINYYPLTEPKEVCDEHTDTGILTIITRTSRPSLEIWDRQEGEYIKVEELLEEGDIVMFVSEKVPLFSCSMRIPAAHHRVNMSEGPTRLSIAYLLDVSSM
eukprot:TRINITY_DN10182_c0_g1_i1.p1 TRINITY_DN10182_c0_g1~~TRINITY_DN10182_c0_g1_i1.p1  ORF type:complete len:328 (+),score=74.89 TRINITY_DN10182_c0_g1_i1:31-1014(+)